METKINPLLAVAVIVLFFAALGFKVVSDGEALNYLGPVHMHTDRSGNLYIQVNNQLLKHNRQGEYIKSYDLATFGIDAMFGDFAFFNNDDVLLRIGPYDPSIWNNIARYLRISNRTAVKAPDEDSGLFRCQLDEAQCRRFGDGSIDFNRSFHLYIDPKDESVYAADASRHLLRKFDRTGSQIAVQNKGFKFPNQLLIEEGKLFIADTNHHVIHEVITDTDNFGISLKLHSILDRRVSNAKLSQIEKWPTTFAKVKQEWWVNNMNGAMRDGAIYRFSREWDFLQLLGLPQDADPIDIVNFNDRILISDNTLRRVYQFSQSGEPLVDFHSIGLDDIMATNKQRYDDYKKSSFAGLILFLILFVAMVIIIVVNGIKNRKLLAQQFASEQVPYDGIDIPASQEELAVDLNDPSIHWIEPKTFLKKYFPLLVLATGLLGVALIGLALIQVACCELLWSSIPMILVFIPVYFIPTIVFRTRIGVLKDMLILVDHKNRYAVGRGRRILLGKTELLIDDIMVFLGSRIQPIYDKQTLDQEVQPLLTKARTITAFQKQVFFFKQQKKVLLIISICTVIYIGWILF